MGVMDKFIQYMKYNDNDDEYYDDDYLDDDEPLDTKAAPAKRNTSVKEEAEEAEKAPRKSAGTKITQMRQTSKRMSSGTGMEVCVMKPTSIEDAREITDTLLSNRTVVLNLEGIDVDIAQRIIDFTSGSTYAISGNLQKISHYIFIITPATVDVSGDFQEIFGGAFDSPLTQV